MMRRSAVVLALMPLLFGASLGGEGYGGMATGPPPPPTAPPYEATPGPLPTGEPDPEPAATTMATPVDPAPEPTEAPVATSTEPEYYDVKTTAAPEYEYEETTAAPEVATTAMPEAPEPPAITTAAPEVAEPEPKVDTMTKEEPAGTMAPAEGYGAQAEVKPAPADEEPAVAPMTISDGYGLRRFGAKRWAALKRVDWNGVRDSDVELRLLPAERCQDRHQHCAFWAAFRAGDQNPKTGQVFQLPLCQDNAFLSTLDGCPVSCAVCVSDRKVWKKRVAMSKLKRTLRRLSLL